MSKESYWELGHYIESAPSQVDPVIRARIMAGRDISDLRYREVLASRLAAQSAFAKASLGFDGIVAPGSHRSPPPLAEVDEGLSPNSFGRFVNFLDLAALTVPCGQTSSGLPAGVQIVVSKFKDAKALRIGQALERARGGLVRVPPGY
jgi:aspartyl-tRNA(Asn)/glutamyl-tRNA(Gln) amidotransferase subunit A